MVNQPTAASRVARTVWTLCFAVVFLDGFDLVIYGTVLPSLLADGSWNMSPETGGAIGSYALIGLMIGALMSGYIADQYGRRKPLLFYTAMFSVLTALCAAATGPAMLGFLRFLVGLALGGALPMAIALVTEYAPVERRNFYNATMLAGYAIGAVVVSLLSVVIVPNLGYRAMFLVGGVIGIAVLPFLAWRLPESIDHLVTRGRHERARALAASLGLDTAVVERSIEAMSLPEEKEPLGRTAAIRTLAAPGYRMASIAFPLAGFCGFILAYGLNTWLPQILTSSGYSLGSSLAFLVALNAGGLLGNLVLSTVADRSSPRLAVVIAGIIACACFLALSLGPPTGLVYVIIFVAGSGALTSAALIFSFTGTYYPGYARGTALGWTMGLSRLGGVAGPLIGGFILGAAIGPEWNFYVFGITALVLSAVIMLVPRPRRSSRPDAPAPQLEEA
ncbi:MULTISPECIES: MFS transporter [Prauserella salsuginis group]|uniref:AAHS family benzoate transporter-like MFS transporter n=2 Tax=Prauserella salsuginis group TaxID=2893672 RepID=A0A839XPL9_9PSEU|nr:MULTISPECIES: MFS transporter [Prauserella salsuginis group]MBB3664691.1 AAHS family benzoate transporter-like MFS transporter [Prauserella sediminis]MCR3722157.1 MFS transporter, AAHS family, benzoate transport protein [Prauserella flava]MCR3736155.1 MFS transporter, AAHS family, benzoate transport protein [Prauserella salsuginis]